MNYFNKMTMTFLNPRMLLVFIMVSVNGYADIEQYRDCNILPKYTIDWAPLLDGQLTPFWAQEYVGADIARDFVRTERDLHNVEIGIVDNDYDLDAFPKDRLSHNVEVPVHEKLADHGNGVTNLIIGPSPIGVAESGIVTLLQIADFHSHYAGTIEAIQRTQPKVINISQEIRNSPDSKMEDAFQQISEKSLLVVSAGNEFPSLVAPTIEGLKNAIVVGSLSPIGFPSSFSSEGINVSILAPSDLYGQSIRSSSMQATSFGGTSGAAPLVSGALANVLSFLPDLNSGEAKVLLEKTSIPTINTFEQPRMNGFGTLNGYKLVRVASRLTNDKFWSQFTKAKRLQYLRETDTIYDFSIESLEALTLAKSLISSTDADKMCGRYSTAISLIRKSFLLDPYNVEARDLLAKIYLQHGYFFNSMFFQSLNYPSGISFVFQQLRDKALDKTLAPVLFKTFLSRVRHQGIFGIRFEDIRTLVDEHGDNILHFFFKQPHARIALPFSSIGFQTLKMEPHLDSLLVQNKYGQNPIHYAVDYGDVRIIQEVMSWIATSGSYDKFFEIGGTGRNPLRIFFSRKNPIEMFRTIVGTLAQSPLKERIFEDRDSEGKSVYHLAAQFGDVSAFEYLLSLDSDPVGHLGLGDRINDTPLDYYFKMRSPNFDMFRIIVGTLKDRIFEVKGRFQRGIYHSAAQYGDVNAFEYLLSVDSDPVKHLGSRDERNKTPLDLIPVKDKDHFSTCLKAKGLTTF